MKTTTSLAIDIGGTKTLVALFNEAGKITTQQKFPTVKEQDVFVTDLQVAIAQVLSDANLTTVDAIAIASRGGIDQKAGVIRSDRILDWKDLAIVDILKKTHDVPILLENDTNAGGLGEAQYGAGKNIDLLLYVTISTGIGTSIVLDGKRVLPKSNGGKVSLGLARGSQDALDKRFEAVISGSAITDTYGKPAYEIVDPEKWKDIALHIADGLSLNFAVVVPSLIVLGGGVSVHFDKFIDELRLQMDTMNVTDYPMCPIVQAEHVEEAVIYGCYAMVQLYEQE